MTEKSQEDFKKDFKDYFSNDSASYLKYRPNYPIELFNYLSSLTPNHDTAYDFGCGSGQATVTLTNFFKKVIGIDASSEQINNAIKLKNTEYKIAKAHESNLPNQSCDLITVVNALHWFDIEKFFHEAKRLLKPPGVIAIWCYNLFTVNESIDKVFAEYFNLLESYWPPERELVKQKYQTIDFPFKEIQTPEFKICENWTLDHLFGYLRTWSAYNNYRKEHSQCPLSLIKDRISETWVNESYPVYFNINLRVGNLIKIC